jgi:hypothetical protein
MGNKNAVLDLTSISAGGATSAVIAPGLITHFASNYTFKEGRRVKD